MSCAPIKKVCDKLVITESITYDSGVLTINLPVGTYVDGEKYCLVLAQDIPELTIIGAAVVITIGDSGVTYPLMNCNCTNIQVCQLRTRTRYSVCVHTNVGGGVFKLIGNANCFNCPCVQSKKSLPID